MNPMSWIGMKKIIITLILLLLIIPIPTHAATVIKPKSCKYTTSVKKVVAKTVTRGNYTVKLTRNGYMKFTPSATRTYEFVFSAVKTKFSYALGSVIFQKEVGKKLKSISIKTNGGKANMINLATRDDSADEDRQADLYLKTRAVKMKLTKGKAVYMYFNFVGAESGKRRIKKVA